MIDKPGDLAGLLTNLEERDILFIDEIHRLSPVIEEYLYSAMEDYQIDIMIESGPNARSVQIKINPFTLIGATTRSGLLTAPLRARFGINSRLEYYNKSILSDIINRSATILDVSITKDLLINSIEKRLSAKAATLPPNAMQAPTTLKGEDECRKILESAGIPMASLGLHPQNESTGKISRGSVHGGNNREY